MKIIPVLDILDSVVVRGVAGEREKYRPVESCIAPSADPLDVAAAFRSRFGFTTIYVADLDAILKDEPNHRICHELAEEGFDLLVDAGVKNNSDVDATIMAGAGRVIAGLETWPSLTMLEMLVHRIGPDRLIFSLDMRQGRPMRRFPDVMSDDPVDIGAAVIESGVRQLIVLDLHSVGTGGGVTTLDICRELQDFAPKVSLITGGGARSQEDLRRLESAGIDGVLVASALHDGSLTPDEVQ